MNYWLFKSEPDVFGIDHLIDCTDQTEPWDGVRNYQARNFMRDDMQVGDRAFFYHSNCKVPGIVGEIEIVRSGYPDHTAEDPESNYHDPKHNADNPRWYMVDVKFLQKFPKTLSLTELKEIPELADFRLVQKGNRLSVMPVEAEHFQFILDRISSC